MLGISIDTLRRWDKSGKLNPVKVSEAGYRLYSKSQIELYLNDIFNLGQDSGELKATFPESNWFVYDTLRETAQKLHI